MKSERMAGSRVWRSGWRPYCLAVGAVAVATVVRWALNPWLGIALQFITFYPAVALVGLVAGGRAGIVTTLFATLLADGLFMEPRGSLALVSPRDWVALGLFVLSGGLMSWMAELLSRAWKREGQVEAQVQGQQALRESEERFRGLFEGSLDAVFLTHPEGQIVAANPAACALFGMTEAELCRAGRQGLVDPADARHAAAIAERRRSGRVSQVELRFRRPGGECFEAAVDSAILPGSPERSFVILRDITGRKAAEERLRESEARFKRAFASSPAALVISRLEDGQLLEVNETFARLVGRSREELIGRRSVEAGLLGPGERAALRQTLSEQGKFEQKEITLRCSNGQCCWVLASAERIELRREACIIWTGFDITKRKQAEEALRRSEARLGQAVRVAGLGTFEHDHRSDTIEYSPVMRELMGFGEAEAVSIPAVVERVLPEDRKVLVAAIQRAHDPAGEGIFQVEYRVRRPEGGLRWLSAQSQTFFEGKGAERRPVRTIGAVLDVTERKDVQAGLERLVSERTAKLQEMVEELEHFSYTITHDMRAPLRGMHGYAELMSQSCAGCPEQNPQRFLERIKVSARRLDALITDALQYSQAVRQELKPSPVEVGALLRGMLDSYPELQLFKGRIQLRGEIPRVLGNEAGLTQVFSNLLSNAVKFVKPGQLPAVAIWAEVRSVGTSEGAPSESEGATRVRIWVEDQGIGMPQSMLPQVFDMFSRGQNTQGTGIGLALVRKVTERMGGKVGVESEEGKGSRFWVELPGAEQP
jgi:PAS domain S-box-containing protein